MMQRAAEPVNLGSPLPRTPHLARIARRLAWWLPPEEALDDAVRFLAQVMTLGTWTDIRQVRAELGEDCFRAVLRKPPAGVFDQRSWYYWHHVFGLWEVGELPRRRIP